MKTIKHLLFFLVLGCVIPLVYADKKVEVGPKGGRLLEMDRPRAEFFVEKNRTISLTFYDAKLKVVPVSEQSATATAETKAGKVKLEFEKRGGSLVSKTPLPEGDGYNLVVQVQARPDARPKNFRIPLLLHACAECRRAEYACDCH